MYVLKGRAITLVPVILWSTGIKIYGSKCVVTDETGFLVAKNGAIACFTGGLATLSKPQTEIK